MEVTEVTEYLSWILDIEFPQVVKHQFAHQLDREMLKQNRKLAEERGIGIESQLTEYRSYSILEALGTDNWQEIRNTVAPTLQLPPTLVAALQRAYRDVAPQTPRETPCYHCVGTGMCRFATLRHEGREHLSSYWRDCLLCGETVHRHYTHPDVLKGPQCWVCEGTGVMQSGTPQQAE